jgi:hypothetical protein
MPKEEKTMIEKFASSAILSLLLISMIGSFSAKALPADSMWIDPSNLTFDTNTSPVGTKFNVTMWLNVTTNTNSWQFYMIYKKALLNATACVYSGNGQSKWSGVLPVNTVSPGFGEHNATYNYVVFGEVLKNSAEKTGAGSLAIVTFQIISAPPGGEAFTTDVRLDNVGVFASQAFDKDFNQLTLSFGKAVYSYSTPFTPPPPAKIYVDPASIVNRTLTPSNNFTVFVRISQATNVSFFDFKLNFNSSVIKPVEIRMGSFFPNTATPTIEINNLTGSVRMFASLTSEPAESGSGILAMIKFHVESLGHTLLPLTDVQIKDKQSHILPLQTLGDGFFSNTALRGDVNGDGKVDTEDVARAEKAFGSHAGPPPDPNWNPGADIDQNGRIDVLDIALVCQNFGQH